MGPTHRRCAGAQYCGAVTVSRLSAGPPSSHRHRLQIRKRRLVTEALHLGLAQAG